MTGLDEILVKLKERYGTDKQPISTEDYNKQKVELYNQSTGNLNEFDGYDCKLCKNRGYFAKWDGLYETYTYCSCKKIRDALQRAKRSGLGNILSDFTFDKFETTEEWQEDNKKKAQAFCNDDMAKWFFIGGQVGAGKTFLCTAICGHYIKAGYDVRYMLWCEESKRIKSLITETAEYQEAINVYKNVDVLYIDDFLKVQNGEAPTAADINLAFEIINNRLLDKNKITIISSEKTLFEIMEYDEATMSRIYEKTGKYKINIKKDLNKNYRLRGKEYA